jgi:hypothetical protein
MRRRAPVLTSCICAVAIACARSGSPAGLQPTPASGAQRVAERIVSAILAAYAARADTVAGGTAPLVRAAPGAGALAMRTPVTLMSWPNARHRRLSNSAPEFVATTQPYRRAWLDSLVATHAIKEFCVEPSPQQCPGAVTTTFLALSDPIVRGDTLAVVQVFEVTLDPAGCRHRRGNIGLIQREVGLVVRDTGWEVIADQIEASQYGRC